MIEDIEIQEAVGLQEYATFSHLAGAVQSLRSEARTLVPRLSGRTVWILNSTAEGGGVAEMLPKVVHIMRELGVKTNWLVMKTTEERFFRLTKRIHNLLHGEGDPQLSDTDRRLYRKVSLETARELKRRLSPEDILVVHDPQPLGVGALAKGAAGIRAVWRCHIGLDSTTTATRAGWQFLRPYASRYDHAVFSAPEYIPPFLAGKASIITPAVDPLSHKNRDLTPHKLVGILCNSGLKMERHPVLTPAWDDKAMRLQPNGDFAAPNSGNDLGLLYRPIVTQVSRWDRLKGWNALLDGFVNLKSRVAERPPKNPIHRKRLEIARLVMAGPDPGAIQDDPEGLGVLDELCARYAELPGAIQDDVAILTLPMESRKMNALMVNALQRCSTVVVQNSLREGFGLTVTEAMWKRLPVVGTTACGIRQQIRNGINGILVKNPEDVAEVADRINRALANPVSRERWGRNAQRTVFEKFLVFVQVSEWLRKLAEISERRPLPVKEQD